MPWLRPCSDALCTVGACASVVEPLPDDYLMPKTIHENQDMYP